MNSRRALWGLWAVVHVVVLSLDQWTKYLVHHRFRWGESIPLFDSVFSLTYVRNTGAAFGFMNRAPEWIRVPFFLLMPVTAFGVILYLYSKLQPKQWWNALALSLISAGAIGNFIDRAIYGYVIDFLDFHWKEVYHWPAFNVADSCIVVGVGILFLLSFQSPGGREHARS
jgi:signal peptidase II